MTTDPTTTPEEPAAAEGITFTAADAIVCADAGLYCEGTATTDGRTGTWRLPVIAFDRQGRPLIALVGSVGGVLIPAAAVSPEYRLQSRTQVVAGSEAAVEYTDSQGVRRLGTVTAWGIDLDGTVQPLHVTGRPATARRVERDPAGNIVGTVEE